LGGKLKPEKKMRSNTCLDGKEFIGGTQEVKPMQRGRAKTGSSKQTQSLLDQA